MKFSDFTDSKTASEENCIVLLLFCAQYFIKNILPVNTKKSCVKAKAIVYNTERYYMQYRYVNTPQPLLHGLPLLLLHLTTKKEKESNILASLTLIARCIYSIYCILYSLQLHCHLITPDLPYNVAFYIKPKPIIDLVV